MRVIGFAHGEHADFLAIFLAKQSKRTRSDRIIRGHQTRGDALISANLRVHIGFNHRNFISRHRLIMREIEPQTIRCNKAALLRHMAAQSFAQ